MVSIRALSNAKSYAMYLAREGIGEWVGAGAEALGLHGEVTLPEYNSLCRGEHPQTGEYLRPIHRVDQYRQRTITVNGESKEIVSVYRAREAYGLILSSPKTVSIQELCDRRLLQCHEHAVAKTISELEQMCGGLVIAAYQHRTTRTQDPLIHTHLVVMNARLKEDGWKALDAFCIYKNKPQLTEGFDGEVLRQAERIGYRLEGPHLAGISDEVFNKFCQRSAEREDAIRQHRREYRLPADQPLSPRQVATLVYKHRGQKQDIPPNELREMQIARLTQTERISLRQTVEKAYERSHKLRLHISDDAFDQGPELKPWTYGQRISM